jgi:DNA-binding transcriptional LysR family regulator
VKKVQQHVDLNLLRVFDAVFEERNLLRASKRLNLSQSAISHALGRLRDALGDELFIRTARGMEPTARALALSAPLQSALRNVYDALGGQPFDCAVSERQFVIAANDYVTSVLITELSRELALSAPGINIVIRPSTRLDLAEQIDVGKIDLALGVFASVPGRLQSQSVWLQHDVLIMRSGHPLCKQKLDVLSLSNYPLIIVSLGGAEEGAVDGYIVERGLARQSEMFDRGSLEAALHAKSLKPRYRFAVPHSLAIPGLLAESDMLSILPAPLAAAFATRGSKLTVKPLPYTSPTAALRALWHRRNEHDPAHIWLRKRVFHLGERLAAPWSTRSRTSSAQSQNRVGFSKDASQ